MLGGGVGARNRRDDVGLRRAVQAKQRAGVVWQMRMRTERQGGGNKGLRIRKKAPEKKSGSKQIRERERGDGKGTSVGWLWDNWDWWNMGSSHQSVKCPTNNEKLLQCCVGAWKHNEDFLSYNGPTKQACMLSPSGSHSKLPEVHVEEAYVPVLNGRTTWFFAMLSDTSSAV